MLVRLTVLGPDSVLKSLFPSFRFLSRCLKLKLDKFVVNVIDSSSTGY